MELYYHEGIEDAMQQSLEDIKNFGIESSPRGRDTKELLGYNFIIENPRNRLVGFKVRQLNPFFLVGNLFWILSQSNELDFIKYYNPKGVNFSDDGKTLRGGYGKRIFDFDGVNQWYQCIRELKIDPDSRRAIITFHLPQHDWHGSLDTPCTASVQFFIRDNKLHMINHMRSQSAAFVMPYDIFLMTMLQELMARELGVELGNYHHFCGSIHYFKNEITMVDAIIDSYDYTNTMPEMPKDTTIQSLKPLLFFERELREKAQEGIISSDYLAKLKKLELDKYWYDFGLVLIAKALEYTKNPYYEDFKEEYLSNTMFYKFFE